MGRTLVKTLSISILVIILMTLPLLIACSDDDEKTENAPEELPDIHVGMSALVTGPYGAYAPITWGYLDYMKDLNERGGIDGAQIEVHWKDCQYDVAQSIAAYADYSKSYDLVAFTGMGTGANLALAERCAEDGIVLAAIGGEPELIWPAQEWVFASSPNHAIGALGAMQYAMEQWDEGRVARVGIAYPNNPFGQSIIGPIEEYASELGYEVVEKQEFELTALDAVSQSLAFRDDEVDIVYVQGTAKSVAVLCKDMDRQGFIPKMVIGPLHVIHPAFPELAAGTGEGVIGWNPFYLWPQDMDNESVQYWRDKALEYSSGDIVSEEDPYMSMLYMWGLSVGVLLEAGLREAAAEVGAANITAEALRNALENVTNFKTGNSGFQPGIGFSPSNHEAYSATSLMQVQDGVWVRINNMFESPWKFAE
ncbi:MAG: ABC transporter substrate-binding protein [Chloroflexi bacterium]|nr:ABC transporter substrate-binding protein [Chloroflexota bacterium]